MINSIQLAQNEKANITQKVLVQKPYTNTEMQITKQKQPEEKPYSPLVLPKKRPYY